jgi:tetratricopeptide (TPR) repeat protein
MRRPHLSHVPHSVMVMKRLAVFRLRFAGALLLALGILALCFDAAASPVRHPIDQRDLARMSARHPNAIRPFEEGEALAGEGDNERAVAFFHEAAEEAPDSALVARMECQLLTTLGRRAEAIQAGLRALRNEASGLDMRTMVAAFMSGRDAPTAGELAQAMRLARRARDTMPGEPWGYAAECDIAERIGDAQMLEGCLDELQRVAPGHDETVRAFEAAKRWLPSWRVWLGWSVLFVLGLGTLVHAIWRASRSSVGRGIDRAAAVLLVLAVGVIVSGQAHAQELDPEPQEQPQPQGSGRMLSEWAVDDKDPESSVPSDHKKERNPLQFGYWLMDVTYKAVQATKKGDHLAAARFYKALAKAVPDRSVSFTRLCESYEAAGEWKNALDACATALMRDGVTVNDYVRFFTVALAKKGSLTKPEIEDLSNVVEHLRGDPVGREIADDLECQLAVRLEDVSRLQPCTAALVAKAPDDPKTISYQWALALKRGNFDEATTLVERARTTAMTHEGIDQMVQGTASMRAMRQRKIYAWTLAGVALVLGAAAAFVLLSRRRRTLGTA